MVTTVTYMSRWDLELERLRLEVELERANAERDALKADAERYRLLRSANVQCEIFGNWTDDLDAALDAALRGEGE